MRSVNRGHRDRYLRDVPSTNSATMVNSTRVRARWVSLHELVKEATLEAYRCKHCRRLFSREMAAHSSLPLCTGNRTADAG